eukprot:9477730-Pyramimonas_sp.AAC.1
MKAGGEATVSGGKRAESSSGNVLGIHPSERPPSSNWKTGKADRGTIRKKGYSMKASGGEGGNNEWRGTWRKL